MHRHWAWYVLPVHETVNSDLVRRWLLIQYLCHSDLCFQTSELILPKDWLPDYITPFISAIITDPTLL